jgi:hypothetical protein
LFRRAFIVITMDVRNPPDEVIAMLKTIQVTGRGCLAVDRVALEEESRAKDSD